MASGGPAPTPPAGGAQGGAPLRSVTPVLPVTPGSTRRAKSPLAGSPVREYHGKLRLLQRAMGDCVSPSHTGCLDAAEHKMLKRLANRVKKDEFRREQQAEDHRRQVKLRAEEKQAQREEAYSQHQKKKHAEHAKQLSQYQEGVKEHIKESVETWWTKHENSKLKIHNDHVKEGKRAFGNLVKREERNKCIERKRVDEAKVREEKSEQKRVLAESRLARIAREKAEIEQKRDNERELRKIEWQKRVDQADRERANRQRRAEALRKEAVERYNEATAFEAASQTFRAREKIRETRLADLELRRKEEHLARMEKVKTRRDRQEQNLGKVVDMLDRDYNDAAKANQKKEEHLRNQQLQLEKDMEERKEKRNRIHEEREISRGKVEEERLRRMDDRWTRNTERCYKYFLDSQ
eukprot:TRINITY_DN28317_c0_g1_i1.p1 TRINITY_DN28317_c0_g1~~TRINITY_DN28317_c0_g1_i1.p1  ORF type:complete len:436 (+),score=187.33 TRINITY_DN28317_c0_g1_i1:86-1309(+)